MKIYKILTLLILCLFHWRIQAQSTFHVSAGATVTTKGNSVITLNNTKFSNNGAFAGTSGTVQITGNGSNTNTTIAGTGTTTFNNLIINKTANNAQLNQNIAVTGNITLTSGGVSLSSGNIDFGSTGSLLNETETNRIFGTGGYLQATAVLNAPNNSNPANLGAIITSTANLGSTVIKRTHSPFVLNGNGINRSFDITPTNNTGLNATVKFNYLDAELNGNTEANLALWKSTNAGTSFIDLSSTNDATNNFIQSMGISSLALFSVGTTAPLPTTPFITTWKVANGNIIIPTNSTSGPYNYTVNYRKKGTTAYTTLSNQTGNCTISGLTDGDEMEVEIIGVFPHFYMNNNTSEKTKLLSIDAWGNQNWKRMNNAFSGCSNLVYTATDNPDLSSVTAMSSMFAYCSKFNGNMGSWNTSNITNMSRMFEGATVFNQDIGSWNTGKVSDMSSMFSNAKAFNKNIGSWNTENVTDMNAMFNGSSTFNQDIGSWNTGKVAGMIQMFPGATAFNQNLGKWDMRSVSTSNSGQSFDMLKNSGLDCANYSASLLGWANSTTPATNVFLGEVTFNDVNRQYGTNAAAARTTLSSRGWTIFGDGAGTGVCVFGPPAPIASAQSYCPGKTVADLVATGQNIQWYNTSTGGTALASTAVLLTATYYGSQTVGGIESSRTAVSITVNAPTTAMVTLSPTTICAGTSGSIIPAVTNGGSNYTYVWQINQVTQTTTSPTINYSNATGNDEYSLTVNPSADACPIISSITSSIRITPLTTPKVFIMPAIVCENTDRTLQVISSTGSLGTTPSYVWKRNGNDVATSSTYSVTNAVLGDSYAVTVTLSPDAGCYTTYTATSSLIVGCILSITSGNWEDPATWNLNRSPLPTDNAVINNNHNVTITTDGANANKTEVRVNSKLIYGNGTAKLKLGF